MSDRIWVPEIVYEDVDDGITSHIPTIIVPNDELMPKLLYIFESRDTGEFEPGSDGEELPVSQLDLHQYANMLVLKESLTSAEYDNVRRVLGLETLSDATQKGIDITNNVRSSINDK